MDTVPLNVCPVCDGREHRRLHTSHWGDLVICRGCQLTRLWSRAEPNYQEIYDETYFTDNYLSIHALQGQTAEEILTRVESLVRPGVLVDYGCGLGVLLGVAQGRGWSCLGLDSSPAALQMARSELPDQVELRLLDEGAPTVMEEESVRCLTFLDSLSNISEMPEVLAQSLRWLCPQGVVVVRTSYFPGRLRFLGWAAGRLNKTAGDLVFHMPQRKWHFTPAPLTSLFRKHGLRIISMDFTEDYSRRRSIPRPRLRPRSIARWLLAQGQRHLVPKSSMLVIAQRQ